MAWSDERLGGVVDWIMVAIPREVPNGHGVKLEC